MGDSQEKNMGKGTGDRQGAGKNNNAASSGTAKNGDGSFIRQQSKERDKVTAALEASFPAEFREMIKQYNINIKGNPKSK